MGNSSVINGYAVMPDGSIVESDKFMDPVKSDEWVKHMLMGVGAKVVYEHYTANSMGKPLNQWYHNSMDKNANRGLPFSDDHKYYMVKDLSELPDQLRMMVLMGAV